MIVNVWLQIIFLYLKMQTENEAKNIDILSQIEKPEFLALSPTTVDEYFLQTLGNLVLL